MWITRAYWEAYGPDAPAAGAEPQPPPTIPFGFTTFPGEIWRTPRSWVEATGAQRPPVGKDVLVVAGGALHLGIDHPVAEVVAFGLGG